MERDNADYAIEMLLSALALEPDFLQARRMLRMAEVKKAMGTKGSMSGLKGMSAKSKIKSQIKKDPAKALASAEELMKMDPLNSGNVYAYIEAALAADNPEAAVMTMELARDHNNADKEYIERLGDLYLKAGQARGAVECFTMVSEMDPNNQIIRKKMRDAAAVNTISGGGWEKEGDFTDKLADADEASRLEQENKAKLSEDDVSGLITALELRVKNEPENITHARRLAELYVQAGEFDSAIQMYEHANTLTKGGDPEIDRALVATTMKIYEHNLAYYEEEGMADEAESTRQEMADYEFSVAAERVEKYPNDREFKFLYGELLFAREDYTEAIRQFQEGKKNPKYRLEAVYYLGRCFHHKGQLDLAVNTLEEAASEMLVMDETKKKVLYELGTICETMGDFPKALDYFKEIYAVDISFMELTNRFGVILTRKQ